MPTVCFPVLHERRSAHPVCAEVQLLISLIANYPNNVLVEILDEHDVCVALVPLCIEDPASIGGNRETVVEIFIHRKYLADLFGGEIEVADGLGRIGGNEIDASRHNGP